LLNVDVYKPSLGINSPGTKEGKNMAEKQAVLNKDKACPSCGSIEYTIIGPPGKVVNNGEVMMAPVGYSTIIECKSCRNIRGL
jgi:hypothetical protein